MTRHIGPTILIAVGLAMYLVGSILKLLVWCGWLQ